MLHCVLLFNMTQWNIYGIKNGGLLLSAEASGNGELKPLNTYFADLLQHEGEMSSSTANHLFLTS